ncbi:MFS transporter [Streptomyces sp. NPDC093109]|uniref:MFS transporter n=1 Tax=Streptomyces sp. NPDC093109 TaxID=3154977 RepID=UPI003450CDAF
MRAEEPRARRRLTLAMSVTGAALVALDGTVLTVAQPALRRDLGASFTQVQWVSTGYLIAVASLLVFSGRLGDRYGHRRVFALGILGFAAASAGIGVAPGVGWVIALRVVQGVFGALLQPATLGMLRAAYPSDRLAMPIALRTSAIGLAAAAGPVVGGALTDRLGWRAVFFLGVGPALVIGALALAVRTPAPARGEAATGTPTTGAPAPGATARTVRLDLPGAGLLAVALVALVHTLVALPEGGPPVVTALGLAVTAAATAAFVRHERSTADPLIPPAVFRSATVTSALGVLLAATAALFGALFLATYFLQDVLALNPLQSGLRALPLAVMMVAGAPLAAVALRRYGPRRTAVPGMALVAAGTFLLSRLDTASTAPEIGGCFLVLGAGFSTVMVTATAVVVRHAPAGAAGVAGGLQQTAMNVGPMLGVAAATMLTGAEGAVRTSMGPALTALAAVAVAGTLLATRLPADTQTGTGTATDATDARRPTPAPSRVSPP